MISVHQLAHSYTSGEIKYQALKEISFSLDSPTFCALMGPSGSGKSTLLSILGLIYPVQSGSVQIFGAEVSHYTEEQRRQFRASQIGFVFQHFRLLPGLDVTENVMFTCLINSWPKTDAQERAHELLKHLELFELRNKLPNQLSGGEMQRVALARALAPKPKLILADEPTGNLDSESGERVLSLLKSESGNGRYIFMATHSSHAASYCTSTLSIKDGSLVL
jgi:putative ABC transport system ATP-binding protein